MRTTRFLRALVAGTVLFLAAGSAGAATITIVPGAGFADATPRAPEGGNSGATLGAQRLIAFQNAAAIWGGKLQSTQTIKVAAAFTDLQCGPTSGVLGSAGPTGFFVLNAGAPTTDRFFAVALAEALLNDNINGTNNEISASFNALLDSQAVPCLGGNRWYYGLTGPVPPGSIAFIPTILHELGHGLGFLSLLCDSPGGCGGTPFGSFFNIDATHPNGIPDIWSDLVRDNSFGRVWINMTNAERIVSFTNEPSVVWAGNSVTANLAAFGQGPPETNGGFMRLYSPNPFEDGSSISHFDEDANPNLLMEPSASDDVFNQTDLTDFLFQDIGWTLAGGGPVPNQAPAVAGPASIAVTEDVARALTGISFTDVDAGAGMLTITFSVPQGSIAATAGVPNVTVGGTAAARTITGTLVALNAYVAASNVTYTTALDSAVSQTLVVGANDNGNTGTGGPQTGSRNITLSVSAVNDAPSVSAPPTFTVTEDVATALTGISVADVDAGGNAVQLTAQVTAGILSTTGSGVTVTGSGTATVMLNGSLAAINTFIQNSNLRYTTALNATAAATLNLTVNDQGNTGSGGQRTGTDSASLTVTGVNDPPSVSGPTTIPVVPTGQSTITGVSFADLDAAAGSITVTWAVASGTMSATAGGGVTVGGSGTPSMTTSGTLANLNAFVNAGNVKFNTPGGTTADIVLTVTANDNGNSPAPPQSGNRQFTLSFNLVYRNSFEDPAP